MTSSKQEAKERDGSDEELGGDKKGRRETALR